MSRKNILIPLLIVISLVVWGRNIYLILFGLIQGGDETRDDMVESVQEIPEPLNEFSNGEASFVYQGKYRDPFQHWLTETKPKLVVEKIIPIVQKPKPEPPRLRFSGLLEDSTGKLAILEGVGGEIYFAHEKDSIEGVQILQVSGQQLQCRFEKEEFILPLRP